MITKGQARRISAAWQAPGNGFSALQHVGRIEPTLVDEIDDALSLPSTKRDRWAVIELYALRRFVTAQNTITVPGWGAWDDTPARA